MVRLRSFYKNCETLMMSDAGRAAAALLLFFAAGVACVQGGDEAPTSSTTPTVNSSITGTTTPGARVATDRGEYSTTASASGSFTLDVASGLTYNVYATANGYKTVVAKGIKLTSGQRLSMSLPMTELLGAGEKTYMGSSQCKLCHSTQYTRWANAPHRFGISAPGDSPGILAGPLAQFTAGFDLATTTAFAAYGGNAPKLSKSGDTYYITIGAIAYPVIYTMGYQWKQRYITRVGEAHYVLPIQWNVTTSEWVTYNPTDWAYTGTTARLASSTSLETDVYKRHSWERKCMGCHSVTGILSLSFSASPSGVTQHRADWVEKGIGCEDCHGPASAHVWANGAIGDPANPNVVNPSRLSADRRNDVCGSCHSRGLSVGKLAGVAPDSFNVTSDTWTLEYYHDGSRTFRPGDTLVAFYTDGGGYWSDSAEVRSSKQHHQQWNDFYQSAHTAPGAALSVTCASCHDVHGPIGNARQLKLSANDNALCLSCHGPSGTAKQRFATNAAVTQHTGDSHTSYAPGTTGAGRCITCHMPFTAKTAVNYDVRSHTFRILRPHNSRRMAVAGQSDTMPNSCQQACHNGIGGGTNFGTGSASALTAAQYYDSNVEHPAMVMPDSGIARLSGTIFVAGATSFTDTFGAWVSADFTSRATVTNRNGAYVLALDAPGTYTIRVMKAGYDSAVTETVSVYPNQQVTLNMTLTANAAARFAAKPFRCGACHGAIWGAEWSKSGRQGQQLSEAEEATDLSAGHGLMQNSPTGTCGPRCHEARSAARYLRQPDVVYSDGRVAADTHAGFANIGNASRRSQTCQVCHLPHDATTVANKQLVRFSNNPIDTFYFFRAYPTSDTGSRPMPAPYKAYACFMCHNARTAARFDGTGLRADSRALSSYTNASGRSESHPVGTPHVGNNIEGFFGTYKDTTIFVVNFDSFPGFLPRNSAHADTWGNVFSFQSFVYSGGAPKLVSQSGAPLVKSDSFTCLSCHMFSQEQGTHSSGTNALHDGGHTWKPDIRACGVCHDPVYISINPYTNPLKSGSGDVGVWGTGKWGVSSSGAVLGFDRPVSVLAHQRNTGGTSAGLAGVGTPDAVSNDYDGDGVAEGAHTEAEHLFKRVLAAMENGTHDGQTSGIAGTIGLGDTFLISTTSGKPSSPYWMFNRTRSLNSSIGAPAGTSAPGTPDFPLTRMTKDELRVAYNLVLMDHDETNLGVHNLRFAVENLRAMWTVVGRIASGNPLWVPPGDDY
jgi:predicted CXXCH cytochrome family protein